MKRYALLVLMGFLMFVATVEAGIFFRRCARPQQPCAVPQAGAARAVCGVDSGPGVDAESLPTPVGQGRNFGIKMEADGKAGQCPDGKCPPRKPLPIAPNKTDLELPKDADRPHLVIVSGAAQLERGKRIVEAHKLGDVLHVNYYLPTQWHAKERDMTDGIYLVAADLDGAGGKVMGFHEPASEGLDLIEQNGERLKGAVDALFDRKKATPLRDALNPDKIIWDKAKPWVFGGVGAASWLSLIGVLLMRRT